LANAVRSLPYLETAMHMASVYLKFIEIESSDMNKYYNGNYLPYANRLALIYGYAELVTSKLNDGYIAYYVNFMFNQLPSNRATQIDIMKKEITQALGKLTTRIVRKPESAAWAILKPSFFGCPDLPVPKHSKKATPLRWVNDGLHFNGILFVPPKRRPGRSKCVRGAENRCSRLRVGLKRHFQERSQTYLTRRLSRIHLTRIRDDGICDYTFKAFKAGKIARDDILVF
jgi:hypothetical protein